MFLPLLKKILLLLPLFIIPIIVVPTSITAYTFDLKHPHQYLTNKKVGHLKEKRNPKTFSSKLAYPSNKWEKQTS